MNREKFGRIKHKSPKFKEHHGEEFGWEDQMELQSRRKKHNKRTQDRNAVREKW